MLSSDITSFTDKQLNKKIDKLFTKLTLKKQPTQKPHAILCGGQPGSGKTTIHDIQFENNPNLIIINGDEYRQHHPNFRKIVKHYGDDSALYTHAFASAVTERLVEKLSSEKYSLLIEGTLRTVDAPLKTNELLKSKGYSTELHVMAVSKTVSWQGTIDRFNMLKQTNRPSRRVPKERHDETADSIPENLSKLYELGVFDRIILLTRDKDCIYDSKLTPKLNPHNILYNRINDLPPINASNIYNPLSIDIPDQTGENDINDPIHNSKNCTAYDDL